ncbi:MAG: FecR domain-containing protein [Desulfovibrionaceae bacterium]
MHLKRLCGVLLLLLILAAQQAQADDELIGRVQTYSGIVAAVAEGVKRELLLNDPLYAKDMLVTGQDAFLQVMLADGTVLALEGDSMLELRDFAYEVGSSEEGRVDMNMIAGGLRFLTGQVVRGNKEAFNIETPLGTIGIRGTEGTAVAELSNPEAFARGLGEALAAPGAWSLGVAPRVRGQTVAHVDGSVSNVMTFADRLGRTVTLERGQAVDVDGERGAGEPRALTKEDRDRMKKAGFSKTSSVPNSFRSAFTGFAGGGRPTSVNVEGGGGNTQTATMTSTENNTGGGTYTGSPTHGP